MTSQPTLSVTHVLIDHTEPLIRAGLAASLSTEPSVSVSTTLTASGLKDPDIVIADYTRSVVILEELGSRPRRERTVRVLVIATAAKAQEIRHAIDIGAHGYLLTSSTEAELCTAVQALSRGQRAICPAAAQQLVDSLGQCSLTGREMEVLRVLTAGNPNKTIADQLDISLGTVKTHVKSILQKLGASSRTHAAAIATQRGVLTATDLHRCSEDAWSYSRSKENFSQKRLANSAELLVPRSPRCGDHAFA